MRYPEVHRRLELIALLSVAESLLLLGPFVLALAGWLFQLGPAAVLALLAASLLSLAHLLILASIGQPMTLSALVNFPVIVMTELVLGNYSMLKYEFSTVDWKGRNICIPVMRLSRLPSPVRAASLE